MGRRERTAEQPDGVKQLQYASQAFDCEGVLSILKAAPTGFAPNGGVGDLVWNLSQMNQSGKDA